MIVNSPVHGQLRVYHVGTEDECNNWLANHPNAYVTDIKFSCTDEFFNVLIIYRTTK